MLAHGNDPLKGDLGVQVLHFLGPQAPGPCPLWLPGCKARHRFTRTTCGEVSRGSMSPAPLELSSLKRHYGGDLAPGCCHLGHRPWQLQRKCFVGEIYFVILEKPRARMALFLEWLKTQSFLESAQISYGVSTWLPELQLCGTGCFPGTF